MNLVNVESLGRDPDGDSHELRATNYDQPTTTIRPLTFPPLWLDAPPETSTEFFPAFVRVSMALQSELRRRLPERFLSDIERFEDVHMAYPLLVYSASRPFPGAPRTDFTYDILNREMMKSFYFSARTDLPAMLAPIWRRLRAAGLNEIAPNYRPDRSKRIIASVQRRKKERRRLNHILIMETRMVNDLIGFAGAKGLRPRRQRQVVCRIRRSLLMRLRRIYAKYDFTGLVQEIIDAITPALLPPVRPPAQPELADFPPLDSPVPGCCLPSPLER